MGLFKQVYHQDKTNNEIAFLNGEAIFTFNGKKYKGYVKAILRFTPYLNTIFKGRIENADTIILDMAISSEVIIIDITSKNISVKTRCFGTSDEEDFNLIFIPTFSIFDYGEGKRLKRVLIHIPNMPITYGPDDVFEKVDGINVRVSKTILRNDIWKIIINSSTESEKREKILKKEQGYYLTHTGQIEKCDGKMYSVKQVKELLECLKYMLSFARGSFTGSIISVGYNTRSKIVWESWDTHLIERWRANRGWFDYHDTSMMSSLFPGFYKAWKSSIGEDLKMVIYWYLRSNTGGGGIEGSIILTQAALELLSWLVSVKKYGLISEEGFKSLNAGDKINMLLASNRIPTNVPDSLKILNRFAKKNNYNGPKVFTEVRNSFVHASDKKKRINKIDVPLHEIYQLGLWYLELTLLALFDYDNKYSNRTHLQLFKGQVEDLPWIENKSTNVV